MPCLIQTMICTKWAKPWGTIACLYVKEIHGWISSLVDTWRFQGSFVCQAICSLSFNLSLSTLNHPPCFFSCCTLPCHIHFASLFFSLCNSCAFCTSSSHSIHLFSINIPSSISASWQDVMVSGPAPSASLCGTGWTSPEWPSVDSAASLSLVLLPHRRWPSVLLEWLCPLCFILLLQLLSSRVWSFSPQTIPCDRCGEQRGRRIKVLPDTSVEPCPISCSSSSRKQEVVHSVAGVCQALQLGRHGPHPQGPAHPGQTHIEEKHSGFGVTFKNGKRNILRLRWALMLTRKASGNNLDF